METDPTEQADSLAVTENKQEESYRLLVESVQEYAIFMLDPENHITTWNSGAQRFFGYTEAEAIGQLGHIIFTEEDRAAGEPEKEIATALQTGKAEDNRWHVRCDGSRFWATGVMTALFAADGSVRGLAKILRDNTDRKLAEATLQESEAHFRQIWEITSDALVLSDAEGIVLDVNPAYLQLYGYTREQIIGQSFALIFAPEQRDTALAQYKAIFALGKPPAARESVIRRADGTELIVEARATFFTRNGKRTGLLSTIRDMTDRKRAELALSQARDVLEERVQERTSQLRASNATLQTEIAEREQAEAQLRQVAMQLTLAEQAERQRLAQRFHDRLQQQLYGIQMWLQPMTLTTQEPNDTLLTAHVQEAARWLDDAIRITRQLTVELSPPILENEGLVEALEWLATHMAETYGLQVTIAAPPTFYLPVADLWVLLFQLVRELLVNVAEHAGTNAVTVALQEQDNLLVIQVSDSGRGFHVAEIEYRGGLGFFRVRERLAFFKGHMSIHSTPGHGTKVTLTLPISQADDRQER